MSYCIKTALYSIIALVLFNGCAPKEKCNCNSLPWVEKYNDSLLRVGLPSWELIMKRFDEKSLVEAEHNTIRFSIHGSFGDCKFYRIEQTESSYSLLTKVYKNTSMDNATLIESHSRKLSENEIQ